MSRTCDPGSVIYALADEHEAYGALLFTTKGHMAEGRVWIVSLTAGRTPQLALGKSEYVPGQRGAALLVHGRD